MHPTLGRRLPSEGVRETGPRDYPINGGFGSMKHMGQKSTNVSVGLDEPNYTSVTPRKRSLERGRGRGGSCVSERGTIAELALFHCLTSKNSPGKSRRCAPDRSRCFLLEKGGSTREAKRVCLSCVRNDCWSTLANDERFGIWGGLSERNAAG